MNAIRIVAPAKVNLGLAVLGKRPDGYHNVDTIMAMLDLADVLTIRMTSGPGIAIAGMDDVPVETNLITRAIRGFCERVGIAPSFHVEVEKHIPSPAGLGGGSSDAAAALRALQGFFPGVVGAGELHQIAAGIGADCPFFLGSPAARASGTGTTLRPIFARERWVVTVVPQSDIQAKTAMLYGALNPDDYLPAKSIDRIEQDLHSDEMPILVNSFTRAARLLMPAVNVAWEAMEDVAGTAALTGAGPSVYTLASNQQEAEDWCADLVRRLPRNFTVLASHFLSELPALEPFP